MLDIERTIVQKAPPFIALNGRLEDRGDRVVLIRRLPWGFIAASTCMLIFLWVFGAFVMSLDKRVGPPTDDDLSFRHFWFGALICAVPLFVLQSWDKYRRALEFEFNRLSSTLAFPSLSRSWPIAAVVGWQIVNKHACGTQLLLLVRQEGAIERVLLYIGSTLERNRLHELLRSITALTGIALVSDVEDDEEQMNDSPPSPNVREDA